MAEPAPHWALPRDCGAADEHGDLARDWPHLEHSRFLVTPRVRWHVQVAGEGPTVLLLHGTGSSSHSWRALMPLLATRLRVIAPDLPGHGASLVADHAQLSLPGMVDNLRELLGMLAAEPALIVGHSAGAAIAVQMALAGRSSARGIVSVNGALLPFGGVAAHLFSPAAKLLARSAWAARAFAWRARQPGVVDRLLASTGSTLDAEGAGLYARLACDPRHVAAALGMMAQWDLDTLARQLPRLTVPLDLVVGSRDAMVPPEQAERVAGRVAGARVTGLIGLGHLAHEEDPAAVARIIERDAAAWGVLAGGITPRIVGGQGS
ncbi:MAG: alpha/beta fold hydrolase BchO [Gammaproteobacteria bacterium]